ncbi:hypothetical protein SISSUDRAFT_1045251 [Sistotremastrum suecicum HHB10207 ss-3]|uniref:DUF6593 domain-containing protein n=1 Tax=Sistotremastrum suecicum HHB10207 ss-3 TaxID=1314776 RepID=A0A166EMA8_9AGAM|nr:hypothetical protein SISSUDRAFT_1045251 [Sistotremastrum suecicum HHB10207 ss-3]
MLLSVSGDGLLHKDFKDVSGNTRYFFESRSTYIRAGEASRQSTRIVDASNSKTLACIEWVGLEPIAVTISGKRYTNLWEIIGKGSQTTDRMMFKTPTNLRWTVEQSRMMLHFKGDHVPVAQYLPQSIMEPSPLPQDWLAIDDDFTCVDIGELLVGWLLVERLRVLKWVLNRFKRRAPYDSIGFAMYKLQSVTSKLGLGRRVLRRASI